MTSSMELSRVVDFPAAREGGRDFLAEMSELISEATAGGEWVPAVVAAELRGRLARTDPELLAGWLDTLAVQFLTEVITTRERSIRATARSRAGARTFGSAVKAGDVELVGSFAVTYVVGADNSRRRVADMTGDDHRFVAGGYRETEARARMLAAFHEQVARKAGDRCTAEVMSEAEYDLLYRSIVGVRAGVDAA